jgi:hypothetical protein
MLMIGTDFNVDNIHKKSAGVSVCGSTEWWKKNRNFGRMNEWLNE